MDHNPYTAPQAVVADGETPLEKRPLPVTIAVVLLALIIVLLIKGGIAEFQYVARGDSLAILFVWRIVKLCVAILLCVQIARGRNWARYLQLAVSSLLLVFYLASTWYYFFLSPMAPRLTLAPAMIAIGLLPSVLGFSALYLLFVPGRGWFRRGAD
jgi:surface polysaccharide O-acyltransferase-like enzyme